MPRRSKRSSRFATLKAKGSLYWAKLAVWTALVGYLAWLSFIHALANITWQQNPDMALRFVPDHPLALSRKADELFAKSQSPATLAKVEAMAKQSLRGGALNPVAIRLLGYVADVRGNPDRARELMLLSQKVSRRDFGTQLWLIEDAVARGDKKQALVHYDIALRTTSSSYTVLLPTLASALADPEVRSALVPYVNNAPGWMPDLLVEAISTSENPTDIVDLLRRSGPLPKRPQYASIPDRLLSKLAEKGQFAAFQQYYLSLKGSSPVTLQSAGLNKATVNLPVAQAGWQLTEGTAFGGGFSAFGNAGTSSLTAFAGSGERGELMRKYLFLKPGTYRFSASFDAQEAAPDSEIRWEMLCLTATDKTSKWLVASPVNKGRGSQSQDFSLGSECPNQLLTLQIAGGSSQTGMDFTLRAVDIKPR